MSQLWSVLRSLGQEEFTRRMEELSSSERKEIFHELQVPAGASVSARRRNEQRIRVAWERLVESGDEEACETFARSWLGRRGMPMIIEFLDRMEVSHKEGYLQEDSALSELDPGRVSRALRELAGRHDPGAVRLYAALMNLPDPAAGEA